MQTLSSESSTRRAPVVTAVTCDAGAGSPSRILSMLDLSEGGFFIQTAYPLTIGTRVQCRFHLGDLPDPVQVHAEVAWVRPGPEDALPPPGMGLRFLRLSGVVQDRIRAVIAAHNAQIQYFQQHRQLSEDAMRLTVPRVQLLVDEDATETRLTAWNGRSLVVTMALPFEPGQAVRAEGEDGHLQEQGKISWIQFVPQGADGPELALGIELQMNTWGQELARRRPSTELATEDDHDEWDYELLQSVPATLTLAPTLPLAKEPAMVAVSERPDAPRKPPTQSEPVLLLRRTPAPVPEPPPTPALEAGPHPRPDGPVQPPSWAPRYPGPQLTTDTYPVSLGVSSGGWPLNARATAIVFGLIVGGLGLYGLLSSGRPNKLSGSSGANPYGWDEFLGRSKSAWKITRIDRTRQTAEHSPPPAEGDHPLSGEDSLAMEKPMPATADPGMATMGESKIQEHASDVPRGSEGRLNALPSSTAAADRTGDLHRPVPVQFSTKGEITRLSVELEGPPTRNHHYTLADPAGVVIDLEGTRILQKNGFLGGDGRRIRKLKVVPMTAKSRLIVYTQSLPTRVQVETRGTRLTVSLHFTDTLARHP